MTRRAVFVCPGRGTYNREELGYLARHHGRRGELIASFDTIRREAGAAHLSDLDGAEKFSPSVHATGDNASALIFACGYADYLSLGDDIEIVAATGNSMGWYTALACAGAVRATDGFRIADTMGRLMQTAMIGGQTIYPVAGDDWREASGRREELLALVAEIASGGAALHVSIRLGGMLVLAGDEAGLAAFEAAVPAIGRYPMRLNHHAAFHSPLQAPVAADGRRALGPDLFGQPHTPLIDGRGAIWRPGATDAGRLRDYTLGAQVTEAYDFSLAIEVAAREYAPDLFIIAGPGGTLGGVTAQALIAAGWGGFDDKASFQKAQERRPSLIAMGRDDQRAQATG